MCILNISLTFQRTGECRPKISISSRALPHSLQDENYTLEFNLAIWLGLVKFMELIISEFCYLNFNYIRYHWGSPIKYNDRQNLN